MTLTSKERVKAGLKQSNLVITCSKKRTIKVKSGDGPRTPQVLVASARK